MSVPIYTRKLHHPGKFHVYREAMGEYAYTVCGQIHNMRRADTEIRTEEPPEGVCGICLMKGET